MANKIKELREKIGLSQVALGEMCDTTGQNIGLIERGQRRLNERMIRKLSLALEVHPMDLLDMESEIDEPTKPRDGRRLEGVSGPVGPVSRIRAPNPAEWPRNLPIRGTAAGASGEFGAIQIEDSQVGYVRRPPGLQGSEEAYALYVVGDSMAPRFFEGHLLFVHPRQPARPGDDVVVQIKRGEHEGVESFVKMLVRKSDTELVVEQYNPPRNITFDGNDVVSIHRIMPSHELVGF